MTSITLRMPEDVVEDLKRIAPFKGLSGYEPLIRAYVDQGLRNDLATLATQRNAFLQIKSLCIDNVNCMWLSCGAS